MINVNGKKNIHMYCSGSGFPGEQFRLLGASSFRTPLEPLFEKYFGSAPG
jgi:hypothetical protein